MAQNAAQIVGNIIFGRWRSQTVHAAVKAGLFELLSATQPKSYVTIAQEANVDRDMCYRVLRAVSSLGLLREMPPTKTSLQPGNVSHHGEASQFVLTDAGCILRKDHPKSLKAMLLLEEGPQHYAIWTHLPDILKDGKQDAFVREYGRGVFDYAKSNPDYHYVFNDAMSSFSKMESESILNILRSYDFCTVKSVCDIGGGHGYLLCQILQENPQIRNGIVMDLAHVIDDDKNHLAGPMGVADRCSYVAGDMFKGVPSAEVYFMKHILHDWNDEECREILARTREASQPGARLFACEMVIPGPNEPSLASLVDIHMAVACTGRQRTAEEFKQLLEGAGWKYVDWKQSEAGGGPVSIIEAVRT